MKKLSLYLTIFSVALFATTAWPNDAQFEITFGQGSVLVICAPPEGTEISTETFVLAFPGWITALQKRANEGIVTRAHYLGELKSGVFIVVGGDTKDIAMTNAVALSDELNAIFKEATGNDLVGGCGFKEIGPVAILPRQNVLSHSRPSETYFCSGPYAGFWSGSNWCAILVSLYCILLLC